MQISDMRAFRTFYTQKHLFNPQKHRPISLSPLNSFQSLENPKFSRHFRCTNHRRSEESTSLDADSPSIGFGSSSPDAETNSSRRRTWTVFNTEGSQYSDRQESGSRSGAERSEVSVNKDFGSVEKARFGGRYGLASSDGGVVRGRKKGKSKVCWVCSDCGYSDGQWWGACRECNKVGTMKQFSAGESGNGGSRVSGFEVSDNVIRSWLPQQHTEVQPLRLTDVNRGINQMNWRIPLHGPFGYEVARVLGGGLVPGSLVLVGGDPGAGKSTLLLQIAAIIAEGHDIGGSSPVVYVSGEESVEQIGNRADRMRIDTEELFLYSSTDIEDILGQVHLLSPRALVVDSIQTVYLKGVIGSAGGLSQVKECTSALLRFAKKTNIPVFLIGIWLSMHYPARLPSSPFLVVNISLLQMAGIGHVTKSGDIAGPRVLEHIVDGEKHSSHRLLRSVKNRFGSTDELGVFEMTQLGLQVVSNPSELFLSEQNSDSEILAGLAVAVIMDGSRSFLLEIQALCLSGSTVARQVNGVPASRADMIIAVLMKQAGLKLQDNGIFLNVVSGVTLAETAGDLAVAAAICSRHVLYHLISHHLLFLEFPIPNGIAFIGEIGLGGELRTVPRMEKRVNTVAKLGYKKCIVPKAAEKSLPTLEDMNIEIVGCRNMKEGFAATDSTMYRTAASRLRALKGHGGNWRAARFASSSAVAVRSSSSPSLFSWLTGEKSSSLSPLNLPLAGVSLPPPLPDYVEPSKTKITTLSNGVKIASETSPNPAASIGLYVDCGSIYETPLSFGATHLLERMAFKSTTNRSHLRVVREVEAIGGNVTASASPGTDGLQKVKAELGELSNNPQGLLLEAIHSAGYSGALANPLLAPESAINRLNSTILEEFVAENYTAPRMVLAASGVEHEEFLSIAEPLVSDLPSVPRPEEPKSVYVGGDYRCQADSGITHLALAFEVPGGWHNEKEAITLTVLQMLMGGGGSFSAGGPGKGMHSRLYLRVLNEYQQLQSFSAFNNIFNNTGIFGIYASTGSDFVAKAVDIAAGELLSIASPGQVDQVQLTRAKEATKSAVLMNLESRMIASEDIGRQILTYGERKPLEHFLKAVDEITLKDITTIAQRIISSPLTMASYGDGNLPLSTNEPFYDFTELKLEKSLPSFVAVIHVPSYESVNRKFHAK
ncbi:Mitochondrial-processing peptidase subunit alpha [Vitis vinifera]|uniref:Mitochondrial-processing peptidase subunit alpha n=1 Tax=Vitis vinifera TaxID=29760 RepID=A0A438K751_VITVI|nr:Mitochondrial-processing peptidase subunit alpha [Vitis vinifera]